MTTKLSDPTPFEESPVPLKNTTTPRVFIAATRQNDGETTASLGLLAALQRCYPRIGYIKPVGQRFVEIEEQKIDEDTILMDRVYRLNCPLLDMSPIAVEPDFTRKYLESSNYDVPVRRIQSAFDRVGVVPHQAILSQPTMDLIREELSAEALNSSDQFHNPVEEVLIGAMGVQNALHLFRKGVLIITPGDREDIILAVATTLSDEADGGLAGMILTRNLRPSKEAQKVISKLPFPVLSVADDSYYVASKVHDLTVKIRPDDTQKIALIRDLIARHVDANKILAAL